MRWLLVLPFLLIGLETSLAETSTPGTVALERSVSALNTQLPPLQFTNTEGKRLALSDFHGKPLIISLVYTGCTDACPAIIENLYPAVKLAQATLGADSFHTVTVGFDTKHDTPDRMRSFARSRGTGLPNWSFLAGDKQTVDKLSNAIGFEIIPSAGGFDHMAQVTLVNKKGQVYRHVYGGAFSNQAIVDPLIDLVYGRERPLTSLEGLIDRVKLFCTVYNPNTGRYYFNYSMFMALGIGLVCLLLVFAWLLREFRRSSLPPGRGA